MVRSRAAVDHFRDPLLLNTTLERLREHRAVVMASSKRSWNAEVKAWPTNFHLRDWISVIPVLAAIGFGPAVLQIGYACHMAFGVGAIFVFLCYIFIVPLLIFAAGRLKFLAWQLVLSPLQLP